MAFDSAQEILLDFGGDKRAALGEKFFNEVFEVYLVKSLGTNNLDTVLLQFIFPSAFDQFLSQVLLKSFFLATFFEFFFDDALLYRYLLVLMILHFYLQN